MYEPFSLKYWDNNLSLTFESSAKLRQVLQSMLCTAFYILTIFENDIWNFTRHLHFPNCSNLRSVILCNLSEVFIYFRCICHAWCTMERSRSSRSDRIPSEPQPCHQGQCSCLPSTSLLHGWQYQDQDQATWRHPSSGGSSESWDSGDSSELLRSFEVKYFWYCKYWFSCFLWKYFRAKLWEPTVHIH